MAPGDLIVTPRGLRYRGAYYPFVLGRGGIAANKCEGDGATPVGVHRVVGMFYRPDRIAAPSSWALPILPNDLWCDAPSHAMYNQLVRRPFFASHEVLRRADPQYDLVLVTNWNWPKAVSGKGSAIFIHQWRRPGHPTAGCIGLDRHDLQKIARDLKPNTRVIVRPQP
ncbi:MAG: L,D-transpeptidase family protein [Boseongicola sp.]|nr:MAG: L,D-transpeptidase family protein [Boseongicola sp.]